MINELVDIFKDSLEKNLEKSSVGADEVIKQIEFAHDANYFNSMLMLDSKNFIDAIKLLIGGKKLQNIAIYPCNSYLEQITATFKDYNLTLCDDFKTGDTIGGFEIVSPEIINNKDFDLVLIISYRELVRDNLMEKIKKRQNIFWIYDVVKKYIEKSANIFEILKKKEVDFTKIDNLIKQIEAEEKPIVFLSGFLFNNYEPTFRALENRGYKPFVICRNNYLAYAKPNSTIEEFGVKNSFKLELMEIVYLCSHLKKARFLINDISFLIPSFDASKAIVNFSFLATLLDLIRVPKFLFLYDVIHSVMKNHHDIETYFHIYQKVLSSTDGLICNSNTAQVHSAIRYTLGVKKPMLSFYRYNEFIPNLKPKIDDGSFHLVIIGGMDDKLRDSTMMLKKILNQKIHVHNYVNNNAIGEFWHQLNEEQRSYFHRHESIVSQYALIEEISQYHAGWIMDNGFEVLSMINSAKNKAFKEMLMMFRLTTISSSLLAMGAAGLPMFLNKMVVHVTYQFPEEFFIPTEEPEVEYFCEIVAEIDWNERYKVTQAKRALFCIDTHIKTLTTWLDAHS